MVSSNIENKGEFVMIKEFTYTSSNGTKSRKVFVIKENDVYIGGLDLNLLSEEDASTISNIYKDVVPTRDFCMLIPLRWKNLLRHKELFFQSVQSP